MDLNILTLDEAGIEGEAVEDGDTLEENACKKAQFAMEHSNGGAWTMADDTGFFINALNGLPGIKAARWAGDNVTTEEIMQHTLMALEGSEDRSAEFKTVAVLLPPDGEVLTFTGSVEGHILLAPRVQPQPMMPYSPIFVPNGFGKCWAEMDVEEENIISHRGKAFRKVRLFLQRF